MNSQELKEIRNSALPMTRVGTSFDVSGLVSLIGNARIVGLGEPTHGDRTTISLKRAVIAALAARRSPLVVAWERSPGQVAQVKAMITERTARPAELVKWIYPWVFREALDLFTFLVSTEAGELRFCGIDMDGPAPPQQYERLARKDARVAQLQEKIANANIQSPDVPTLQDVADLGAALARDAGPNAAEDQDLWRSTEQWARFRLAEMEADGLDDDKAQIYRDRSMAENVLRIADRTTGGGIVFSAHNGHVSRKATMAGGRIAERRGSGYLAIGMAFGSGGFMAGTAKENGFDPKLRVFEADKPPAGSLESMLAAVGPPCFTIDLRPFRGTSHPLARTCTLREVSLAGGRDQFQIRETPADLYDLLVWIERVQPASILRDASSFW